MPFLDLATSIFPTGVWDIPHMIWVFEASDLVLDNFEL
jgi:hypothetical protein